jgi:pentatricopeptide repeat protein
MTTAAQTVAKVDFCGTQISRLIIGGNQFRGYSHFSPELNEDMRDYHTVENVVQTLLHAQACGLNCMQSRGDAIIFAMIDAFRAAGGQMHWIAQTASEQTDLFENIRQIAAHGAWGIYWHGSMTDRMWRAGRIDEAEDYLKAMRDAGVKVGIACHMPEVLQYIEDKGWDLDFYMTCFYNIAKVERDSALVSGKMVAEPFDDPDRDVACQFIRRTEKPCIAYKILAASRKCGSEEEIRGAFKYAFENIKSGDIVNVGMFQKYTDQVAMNSDIVRGLLEG